MESLSFRLVGRFILKFVSVVIFGWAFATGASEDAKEMSFIEKLRAQEEQEYLAFENEIITMSDSDYKVMLAQRMEGAFVEPEGTQKLAVIVDVSEQMNQSISGVVQKIMGTEKGSKLIGIESIQRMLTEKKMLGASELTLTRQESSDDGSTHYQKVEGIFTEEASQLLLSNPKVTDLFVVKKGDTPTTMETFYVPKGRVIPAPSYKKYDDDFIDEGLYQDVLARLEKTESVDISINFHRDKGFYDTYTVEKKNARMKLVNEFLDSMSNLNIEAHEKRPFAIYATVDRDAAKAIYEDPRINYIRLAKKI